MQAQQIKCQKTFRHSTKRNIWDLHFNYDKIVEYKLLYQKQQCLFEKWRCMAKLIWVIDEIGKFFP